MTSPGDDFLFQCERFTESMSARVILRVLGRYFAQLWGLRIHC